MTSESPTLSGTRSPQRPQSKTSFAYSAISAFVLFVKEVLDWLARYLATDAASSQKSAR